MISFKNKFFSKAGRVCCGVATAMVVGMGLSSCEDFFEQESDHVLFADQ